jgi:NAD(P)-dependent dehydrogenase (short-subunit alcohol dehydrogenase family)
MTRLDGKVALVTGASRGVGKGIALALGDARATVYVTGWSVAGGEPTTSLSGTIDETAAEVSARGGKGIALPCDHRNDDSAREAFARIEHEAGRIDVLVNNAWGGYEIFHEGRGQEFEAPFWEQSPSIWDAMFSVGVRSHPVSSTLAAPLMVEHGGLIVNTSSFAGANSKEHVALGTAKAATDRLTLLMAEQLRERSVAVVSLYPGLVRTEGILKWEEYIDLSNSESPTFVGRAVVALATDPDVLARTGEVLVVAELAEEYGFDDEDGAQPQSLRPQFELMS